MSKTPSKKTKRVVSSRDSVGEGEELSKLKIDGMSELINSYDFDITNADKIIEFFVKEIYNGLNGKESSLCMIPSFIDCPSGKEEGIVLSIDFGGTSLRCMLSQIKNNSISILATDKTSVDPTTPTGEELFDKLASFIEEFLKKNDQIVSSNHLSEQKLTAGFSFSFPVHQTSIGCGKLLFWGKEFVATGVQGEDVVDLLHRALKKRNLGWIEINVLCNDAVGTIATVAIENKETQVGIILGTGTNACYRELTANIGKIENSSSSSSSPKVSILPEYMLINTEWGGFNGFPTTAEDRELFQESVHPTEQNFEKQCSGRYLAMIVRKCLQRAIKEKFILADYITKVEKTEPIQFDSQSALTAVDLDKVLSGPKKTAEKAEEIGTDSSSSSPSSSSTTSALTVPPIPTPPASILVYTREMLAKYLSPQPSDADAETFCSAEDLQAVYLLIATILRRSSKFVAVALAALVFYINKRVNVYKNLVVAADGSIIKYFSNFLRNVECFTNQCLAIACAPGSAAGAAIESITPSSASAASPSATASASQDVPQVHVVLTEDGSGVGAGVFSAVQRLFDENHK